MTGAFAVAAGLGLLAAPGALLPSVPLGGRETARLVASTLVAGLVLVATGLIFMAAPAIAGVTHLGDVAEMCARVLTPLTPRRDVVGLLAGTLSVLLLSRGAHAGIRAQRGARRARAEPWLGDHEDRQSYELVVVPTDQMLAYSVPGRKPQVIVSRGLLTSLDGAQVEAVIRHEAAHHAARHSRYVMVAIVVEGAFRPLRWVARSTALLRTALEDWADAEATSGSAAARATLRSALVAVACHLVTHSRRRSSGFTRRTKALNSGARTYGVAALLLQRSPVVLLTSAFIMVALVWAGGAHHVAAAAGYCFD